MKFTWPLGGIEKAGVPEKDKVLRNAYYMNEVITVELV